LAEIADFKQELEMYQNQLVNREKELDKKEKLLLEES